jgi:hypothetical protein
MTMVDAIIKPVFVRQHMDTEPKVFTFVDSLSGAAANATHNIIPGAGETWSINYVKVFSSANSGNNHKAYIQIVNGATVVTIEADLSMTAVGDSISFGSFGNGPLLTKSNFYLRVYVVCEANTVTFDTVVSVTKV